MSSPAAGFSFLMIIDQELIIAKSGPIPHAEGGQVDRGLCSKHSISFYFPIHIICAKDLPYIELKVLQRSSLINSVSSLVTST